MITLTNDPSMGPRFDLVIEHGEILTMDAERSSFPGWLAVEGNSIAAVGPGSASHIDAARRIDASGCVVRPGYVSAHQHSMDAFARATAVRPTSFPDWLFGVYYSTVGTLTPADAARSAELVADDLLRSGVTTLVDCWGVGDVGTSRADECLAATIEVADRSGLRWILAPMVADRLPSAWTPDIERVASRDLRFRPESMVSTTDAALDFMGRAIAAVAHHPRLRVWGAPELPEMASDELISGLAELMRHSGGAITTHLRTAPDDPPDHDGRGEVERLIELGAGDPHLLGAHLTHGSVADLALLHHVGAGAAHCPSATMMLGGSSSVAGRLAAAGVPTGLGLDNPSLNTGADMGAEMRQALMFDRTHPLGTPSLTADDVVAMATCDGARAIGLPDVGSIEVGKAADLVVVDRTGRHWLPRRDAVVAACFQERPGDVRHVIVDGREVVFGDG